MNKSSIIFRNIFNFAKQVILYNQNHLPTIAMKTSSETPQLQVIQNKVFEIRGQKVMTDFHLAEMYEVETRVLKQAVRRNIDRFPSDFMFQLTKEESIRLIINGVSQFVIPPNYNIGSTYPFVFTEQGVAMLSSVLKNTKAIQINIAIMRAFVELRKYALGYEELKQRLDHLEIEMNVQFGELYEALTEMADKPGLTKTRNVVGYIQPGK